MSIRTCLVALLVACALFVAARPAQAQGTSDLFPDPLTSADFESLLDRVGLAGDARASALRGFEEYVTKFLDLRKGDIETYLQGRIDLMGGQRTREEIDERVRERERLLKRLGSIEAQLFDGLAPLAGDAGTEELTRARQWAERRRHWMAANSFMGRGARVELREILDGVVERTKEPLASGVREQVDALLIPLEESLTSQSRKLIDIAVHEPLAIFDARTNANLQSPTAEPGKAPEPGAWSAYFRGLEDIRKQARAPQQEVRRGMRKLNRDAVKRIADVLPATVAQSFRDAFYGQAYGAIAISRDPVPGLLREAQALAKSGEITAEALASIEASAASHIARRNELNDRIAQAIDEEIGEESSFVIRVAGDEGEDASASEKSESQKLLEEREALDNSVATTITSVSPKLASRDTSEARPMSIAVGGMQLDDVAFEAASVMIVGGEGGDVGEPIFISESVDFSQLSPMGSVGVVQPMQSDWVERLSKDYALSNDQRSIAQLVFDDYRSKYRAIEEGELAELKSLPSAGGMVILRSVDGTPEEPAKVTPETTQRRFALKRSITEGVIALDREFFDSVGAALSDVIPADEIVRLKNERERSAYIAADRSGGLMMVGGLGSSNAPSVDLAAIVREATLDREALTAIRPRLDLWDSAATAAFRTRFEEKLAAQQAQEDFDRMMSERAAADGRPGEIRISSDDESFEKMQAIERRVRRADDTTRALNEGAKDDLLTALPTPEAKGLLRDAWNRRVWPNVFRDRRTVQPKIDMALALEDLSAEAKTKIKAIAAEHLAEYRRIGDEMIDAHEKSQPKPQADDAPAGGMSFDPAAIRKRQETMNRLTFERDELNEKTFRRLKECLTEEQAAKLGALPDRKPRGMSFESVPGSASGEVTITR